jgi:hypothetical protein
VKPVIADPNADITPADARRYVENFSTHTLPGTAYAVFPDGMIVFSNMTDLQAVRVAKALMVKEIEAANNYKFRIKNIDKSHDFKN